jgi:hypothetical protein
VGEPVLFGDQCLSFKHGEYNPLVCCRPKGHDGDHNYVVASKHALHLVEMRRHYEQQSLQESGPK